MSVYKFFLSLSLVLFLPAVASFTIGLPTNAANPVPVLKAAASNVDTGMLALSLKKPLGLILEENEEGAAAGVFVKGFSDSGSALDYQKELQGCVLAKVQGADVTKLDFDTIMDQLINAPETVDLAFVTENVPGEPEATFSEGTKVTIRYKQDDGSELNLDAKVGDNLRQVLLDNKIQVYQGLKQTLGNCGGAGQCTFCAMDFIESEGWLERSDYEDKKLAKFPKARLACLNTIQGPATIQKTQR